MAVVKTAISLQEAVFLEVEKTAAAMKISRSRLIEDAIREQLRRLENRRLTDRMNAACDLAQAAVVPEEARARRRLHRKLVEGTW